MANKRQLKKEIKYVCGDLAAECLIAKNFIKGVDKDAMIKNISDVASLMINTLDKVSFAFDKRPGDFADGRAYRKARRDYYTKAYAALRTKFYDRITEIVKAMNAAVPAEVKAANKKA